MWKRSSLLVVLILFYLVVGCSNIQNDISTDSTVLLTGEVPLPAWESNEEKEIVKNTPRIMNSLSLSPPSGDVYVSPEYGKMNGIFIHVPMYSEMVSYFGKIIKSVVDSGANVYLLQSSDEQDIIYEYFLQPYGVSLNDVQFITMYNDALWSRDFGPWYVFVNGERSIIDMKYYPYRVNDDAAPISIGEIWNEEVYSSPVYTEGGNFMTDGLGTCWTSTGVLQGNNMTESQLIQQYQSYLGCDYLYFVSPLTGEGTTHIDMFSKILNQDTILVGYSNSNLGAYSYEIASLNEAAEFYKNTPKPDGGEWNIVRIPMTFSDSYDGRVYNSHTNSLIVNKHVLVPIYGQGTDSAALEIYEQAMPGYTVVGIDSTSVIPSGGAIHCTTMQMPAFGKNTCGNGVIEAGEQCEPSYLKGKACADYGFSGGNLYCNSNCTLNTSGCSGTNTCGNDAVENGEVCDGQSIGCTELESSSYISGTATCNSSCSGWNTNNCVGNTPDITTITKSNSISKKQWHNYGPFSTLQGNISVKMTGSGDADVYVNMGSEPTGNSYDCRPYLNGSSESCELNGPGVLYVSVYGYAANSSYNLIISFVSDGEEIPETETVGVLKELNGSGTVTKNNWKHYGPFTAVDGAFSVVMLGTGDADLFVKKGSKPNYNSYDCRPYLNGSSEVCNLAGPGEFYVSINGYANSSDFELTIKYFE